jgi:hypothetical protein
MNEQLIRESEPMFRQHVFDKAAFKAKLFQALEQSDSPAKKRFFTWKKGLIGVGIPVALGSTIAFSPTVASALQNVPVVNVVLQWLGNAPASKFVTKINQPCTDHGITVTITDVLYDHGQLDIGYTVSPVHSDDSNGGLIPLGRESGGMEFFVDGKPLEAQGIATQNPTKSDYEGLVNLYPSEPLPDSFNLQIAIHKVGNQRGDWSFTVPVSRQKADSATRTYLPMVTHTFGQTQVTVKKVKIAPATTEIDYEVIMPAAEWKPVFLNVVDDKGRLLQSLTGRPLGALYTNGGMETREFEALYDSIDLSPKYLIVIPWSPLSKNPSAQVSAPITGRFPITLNEGALGQVTVTKIDFLANRTLVHYRYHGNFDYPLPYLTISDQGGSIYANPIEVNGGNGQYAAVFGPMNTKRSLKISTTRFETGDLQTEMFKVPLH